MAGAAPTAVVACGDDHDPGLAGERRRRPPRRAGVASRPAGCARPGRVAHRRDRRRHRRRRRARTQRARRGRRVRRRDREHGSRQAARARDRRGRRRFGRAMGTRRPLPRRAASTRSRPSSACSRPTTPTACGAGSWIACTTSSAADWAVVLRGDELLAQAGDDVPDGPCSTRSRPVPARRRRSPPATPAPKTSPSRRCRRTARCCSSAATAIRSAAANAINCSRSRGSPTAAARSILGSRAAIEPRRRRPRPRSSRSRSRSGIATRSSSASSSR